MDKNELRVQALREALREKVASITDEYETRIVDLRIEITEAHMLLEQKDERIAELESQVGAHDVVPEDSDAS